MAKQSAGRSKAKASPPRKKQAAKPRGKSAARRPFITVEQFIDLAGLGLTGVGLLTLLAMIPSSRPSAMQPWLTLLALLGGDGAILLPLALLALGIWLVARRFVDAPPPPWYRLFGMTLVALTFFGFLGMLQQMRAPATQAGYGGLAGRYAFRALSLALGPPAAPVALLFMGLLGLLFLFELSLADVARGAQRLLRALTPLPAPPRAAPVPSPAPLQGTEASGAAVQLPLPSVPQVWGQAREWWERFRFGGMKPDPAAPDAQPRVAAHAAPLPAHAPPLSPDTPWDLPPWQTLLEDAVEGESNWEDIRRKTRLIEETLGHFGVPVSVVEVNRGPTVTQFGVEPGFLHRTVRGVEREIKVKISAITSLENDLALALAAPRIRIEAPVPGRGYVGIEVPNDEANAVTLRGTMETEEFQHLHSPLRVALGRDVTGNAVVADLARMPHLLIAGATGSGKSVCINGIICCLLCNNTPDQLKVMMVDPKMVELIGYNGIPHLIVPVVTDVERVVGMLRWTVNEMERRYKIFSQNQVRNLQGYNAKMIERGEKPLPYLVLIIDELADLMMAAADQVETMICRLAQMARATGIHMILATQRPSVDVVTGLIKANFPARVAFAVTSQIDSRVILDRPGAEALLGRGDMLYMSAESSALVRAQGCYVSDREIERINAFWLAQGEAMKRPAPPAAPSSEAKPETATVQAVLPVHWDELLRTEEEEEDDLLPKAREIVAKAGSCSISMLQRRLRVGYARAARIVDLLEAEGTIGASEGPGKTRDVFRDEEAEQVMSEE